MFSFLLCRFLFNFAGFFASCAEFWFFSCFVLPWFVPPVSPCSALFLCVEVHVHSSSPACQIVLFQRVPSFKHQTLGTSFVPGFEFGVVFHFSLVSSWIILFCLHTDTWFSSLPAINFFVFGKIQINHNDWSEIALAEVSVSTCPGTRSDTTGTSWRTLQGSGEQLSSHQENQER